MQSKTDKVIKMKTLNQAQKELTQAIETMHKVKKENTTQNDWPAVKRTLATRKTERFNALFLNLLTN